ncbi:MAG: flagellar basal body rod protein FlgB [Pseudomonadota bacterium]
MLNKLTQSVDFQGQALVLRSERQRVLASNIANADTPGYAARDMNFNQALQQATGNLKASAAVAVSAPGHIGGRSTASTVSSNLTYAAPSQNNLDGNSVDMDRERASIADNSIKYEATLRFINSNVRTMLEAIKGQ